MAKCARDMISSRVVRVEPEQRLRDVGAEIRAKNALYGAVVDRAGKFVGLIRLTEVVLKSPDRICADLVSVSTPLDISETLDAELVIKLLQAQGCDELVVLAPGSKFVGLATRESVFAWWAARHEADL